MYVHVCATTHVDISKKSLRRKSQRTWVEKETFPIYVYSSLKKRQQQLATRYWIWDICKLSTWYFDLGQFFFTTYRNNFLRSDSIHYLGSFETLSSKMRLMEMNISILKLWLFLAISTQILDSIRLYSCILIIYTYFVNKQKIVYF